MIGNVKKKTLIIIIAAVVAATFGLWWVLARNERMTFPFGVIPKMGPVLNPVESVSNPMEKVPDLNPIGKANPFKGLYKNPFE